MNIIKPPKLNSGDKVATVSLAWGCAGDPDVHWQDREPQGNLGEHFPQYIATRSVKP